MNELLQIMINRNINENENNNQNMFLCEELFYTFSQNLICYCYRYHQMLQFTAASTPPSPSA